METIDGSKITNVYPEFDKHIKILVLNEDRQTPYDTHKEYYLSIDDLRKILNEFDFEVEKKRKRSWVTKWIRRKPEYKVYTRKKVTQ